MKYYLRYEKEQTERMMIYCNKDDKETPEDIVKSVATEEYVGRFVANKYTAATCCIEDGDDENMFILKDSYGYDNIWEVHGNVYDSVGVMVPHLYRVIKIGIMFD